MSTFITPPTTPRASDGQSTPPSSPGTPTDAKTRELISWLMQVNYHASIASAESLEILSALSLTLPDFEHDSPELTAVIAGIEAFGRLKIYDPLLSNKASSALESLSKKLPSPIKLSAPQRSSAPQNSSVARTLFYEGKD